LFSKMLFMISWLAGLPYLIYKLNTQLHMLQLNSYMNSRYLLWLRRNFARALRPVEFLPLVPLLLFVLWLRVEAVAAEVAVASGTVAASVIFGLISLLLFFSRPQIKAKKKLSYTARVKRLFAAVFLLTATLFLLLLQRQAEPFAFLLVLGLLQLLVFALVLGSNTVLAPVEKSINYYYYRDAARKIGAMPRLKVIGITGSYGKTSTKHIVQKILAQKFNVLMTPGSYNTTMGVVLTIRKMLSPLHDLFITEMGAKKVGDITEICQLVKPTYGILTSIGPQHLETFKTLDNVQKTKYELIRALPPEGMSFLNSDDPLIMDGWERYGQQGIRYITYGIDGDKAEIQAKNIRYSEEGMDFTAVKGEQEYSFSTKLLGKHNLYNILAGISLGFALGMDYKSIYAGVRELTPIEHRLQIKRKADHVIVDDAYNANPVGTKMALEVLQLISGNKKILITPGMIELGSQEYELNKTFGRQAAQVCDYIILVGEKQTKPLQDGLRELNYPQEKYCIVKDIFAAFQHLEIIREKNDIILIENDLTDDYSQ